jgi:hypothetical protein
MNLKRIQYKCTTKNATTLPNRKGKNNTPRKLITLARVAPSSCKPHKRRNTFIPRNSSKIY